MFRTLLRIQSIISRPQREIPTSELREKLFLPRKKQGVDVRNIRRQNPDLEYATQKKRSWTRTHMLGPNVNVMMQLETNVITVKKAGIRYFISPNNVSNTASTN